MPAVVNDNARVDDPDADPTRMARAEMERRAAEVAGLLKTLSHPLRLMLVCALVEGEYGVGALEERIGIGQPTLSQHLGVLRAAGLVETRREAKQVFYRLTDAKAARLVEALYTIFCVEEGTP
ncbi:transcriptional regulator [Rhodospirillum rubrum]|uniref:sulfite-sensing transcriptional repressor BigR n=1 Tax=Rhodospirillum rubrum TaxID=1085 RepID=UPI001904F18B|nr:sulfite-sensing transcriptional repressor BigR [Rhodospirillum rubrum]MBK1665477.1 transcriptional regulator [Rhodospirillum rubrum]MBK1677419.1 transcriptional regulator [Rhodospirillum rubrum]